MTRSNIIKTKIKHAISIYEQTERVLLEAKILLTLN